VRPGGVAADLDAAAPDRLRSQCAAIEDELRTLRGIYEEHAGLQDRFMSTGRVAPELAAQLGLTGLAGRASGQAADLRCDHRWAPYDGLAVKMAVRTEGDVAARVAVRFDEAFESLRLIRTMCAQLPRGATQVDVTLPSAAAFGAGWVEGWRGEVFVALELGSDAGRLGQAPVRPRSEGGSNSRTPGATLPVTRSGAIIRRCHCHDPSWQNWPVLEHAVIGNIVPDFPLINKSFNLSYSGQDL